VKLRPLFFDLHRWLGLKFSILISFILITGTLATLSYEIDWLIDPQLRVAPQDRSERAEWAELLDAAQSAYPTWTVEWVSAPVDPWFAAEAVAITPEGERRRIRLDPYTAEVRGDASWVNAQRILRDAHRRLMIFHPAGIILVSIFGVFLLGTLISGLVIYRKFWRGFFKKPRTRDARTLWGDLHRLGGVWSIWFVALMGLTGVWYLAEATFARAPADALPYERVHETPQETAGFAGAAEIIANAEAAFPGLRITAIYPAARPDEVFVVQGQASATLVRQRANAVELDSVSGAVLRTLNAEDLGVHHRLAEMADPLHFGTFWGLSSKLIYFVFGVILSGLSLSGVYIFSRRIRRSAERRGTRPVKARTAASPAE